MPDVAQTVERMLNALPFDASADPTALFAPGKVKERNPDSFALALQRWLETNRALFNENIRVTILDSATDQGVDVLLEGEISKEQVGFQIKSERDVRAKDFAPVTQMQRDRAFEAYHIPRLVLILACPSSARYQRKYGHFLTAAARSPTRPVLMVEPERAARLWRARAMLLPPEQVYAGRAWPHFFSEVRQSHLRGLYVDRWLGHTPDQRFVPPAEFQKLRRAVAEQPLTVLTGPPAIGKTFCAMQMLYQHYRAGRAVQWLTAANLDLTDGPIARSEGAPDLAWRVEQLVRSLGRRPGQPPLNPTEFLGRQMEPGTLIYLEDPFGKTEDEFTRSLSTYAFFDLNRFVDAVLTEPGWQDCRFLITSRDGLFERWQADLRRRAEPAPRCEIVTVTGSSYSREQRAWYIAQLAAVRSIPLDRPAVGRLARRIETLYEAEQVLHQLPPGAGLDELLAEAERERGAQTNRTDRLLLTASDAERLFLFLTAGLNWANSTIIDFAGWYAALYRAMELEGDPEAALGAIPLRMRSQFTREMTREEQGWYTLRPNHSTVLDSISRALPAYGAEWATRLSHGLRQTSRPDQTPGVKATLAHYLLMHAPRVTPQGKSALRRTIFRQNETDPMDILALASQSKRLDAATRSDLVALLSGAYRPTSIDRAAVITLMEFPAELKWAVLRGLVGSPIFTQDPGPLKPNPWSYLFREIDQAPPDLLEALDNLARAEPSTFAQGLAKPAVAHWERVLPLWQGIILWDCQDDAGVQHRLLDAIAEGWPTAPAFLRRYLRLQSRCEDRDVRIAAYTAALRHHKRAPAAMQRIWQRALLESDVRVPLSAFRFSPCVDQHHRRFAEALLARADKTVAAAMLQSLTRKGWPITDWGWELVRSCQARGAEYAEAYCTHEALGDPNFAERMAYTPASAPEGQFDPVRFAWVWAFIQSGGDFPNLPDDRFLALLCGLPDSCRRTAVAQVLEFEQLLPGRLIRKLKQAESRLGLGPEFFNHVRQYRDPGSIRLMEFPVWLFFPEGADATMMRFERLYRRAKQRR